MINLEGKILEVLQRKPLASLATITDDGLPWARYVVLQADEKLTLYVPSHMDTRKMGQIREHPEVHLTCGASDPTDTGPYLQIQGRAKLSTRKPDRHKGWSKALEGIFTGPNDALYEVIVVTPYVIEYCCPKNGVHVWESKNQKLSHESHDGEPVSRIKLVAEKPSNTES